MPAVDPVTDDGAHKQGQFRNQFVESMVASLVTEHGYARPIFASSGAKLSHTAKVDV